MSAGLGVPVSFMRSMGNANAVNPSQVTGNFVRPFDKPAALGLLEGRPRQRRIGGGVQYQHRTTLILFAEQINQLRTGAGKVQPAHLEFFLEKGAIGRELVAPEELIVLVEQHLAQRVLRALSVDEEPMLQRANPRG